MHAGTKNRCLTTWLYSIRSVPGDRGKGEAGLEEKKRAVQGRGDIASKQQGAASERAACYAFANAPFHLACSASCPCYATRQQITATPLRPLFRGFEKKASKEFRALRSISRSDSSDNHPILVGWMVNHLHLVFFGRTVTGRFGK